MQSLTLKPRLSENLHSRSNTALHETGWFTGPYCEVGFLHQNKDCIFGFSIPVASFSYVDWIGANTVPRRKEAPTFGKFALTVQYGAA